MRVVLGPSRSRAIVGREARQRYWANVRMTSPNLTARQRCARDLRVSRGQTGLSGGFPDRRAAARAASTTSRYDGDSASEVRVSDPQSSAVAVGAGLLPSLRTQVRRAVEQAWGRAIASGALPAVPDGTALPDVEIERPASTEHGDFATNL